MECCPSSSFLTRRYLRPSVEYTCPKDYTLGSDGLCHKAWCPDGYRLNGNKCWLDRPTGKFPVKCSALVFGKTADYCRTINKIINEDYNFATLMDITQAPANPYPAPDTVFGYAYWVYRLKNGYGIYASPLPDSETVRTFKDIGVYGNC